MLPRRVSGRCKALPAPAFRDRGFLGFARFGSLVADVPRRQKVCFFRPQATGLSIVTRSLHAGARRGLDHLNRPNELRGSEPGIQAHSNGARGVPLAGAIAPG
jgi:hypothetical protein